MTFLAWLTLLAPLGVAVTATLSPKFRNSPACPKAAIGSVVFCLLTALLFWMTVGPEASESSMSWFDFRNSAGEGLLVELGVLLDPLAVAMLLVVGGVGSAIFVFALGYMKGDPSIGRFYAKFALFVFSMLGIVLANNFLMIFIFWELVGVSSYLLIGYYWQKPSACEAAKKAFLTNRVADFGFLLGILLIWRITGSFNFEAIQAVVADPNSAVHGEQAWMLGLAAFLIFVGAAGKSAQVPFHVWLPDAMEGPTPVSALMHAATMVAAGVYMVVRVFFCFGGFGGIEAWGNAPEIIAYTGGVTAFLAATMALVQRDIKKVLAYSTLSQLGYMVMALGVKAYSVAMFHLVTHAFFKGLLFLCAGSVIHGCHHEQDMFKMGGLRKKMPTTFWTFTVGMLALTGIFPFAGFWSKDLVLDALHITHHDFLYWLASATAGLTAFYMGRAWILTFFGNYRGHHEPHESPKVMTLPLKYLAVMSLLVGFFFRAFQGYLGDRTDALKLLGIDMSIAVVSTFIALTGYGLAWFIYVKRQGLATLLHYKFRPLHTTVYNRYYIDDFYLWFVRRIQQGFAAVCLWIEEKVIVGVFVDGSVKMTRTFGDWLRHTQTGRVNLYAYVFLGGVTVLALLMWVIR